MPNKSHEREGTMIFGLSIVFLLTSAILTVAGACRGAAEEPRALRAEPDRHFRRIGAALSATGRAIRRLLADIGLHRRSCHPCCLRNSADARREHPEYHAFLFKLACWAGIAAGVFSLLAWAVTKSLPATVEVLLRAAPAVTVQQIGARADEQLRSATGDRRGAAHGRLDWRSDCRHARIVRSKKGGANDSACSVSHCRRAGLCHWARDFADAAQRNPGADWH
jgi:uncharacterized protein YjeT (DUF2065 family)